MAAFLRLRKRGDKRERRIEKREKPIGVELYAAETERERICTVKKRLIVMVLSTLVLATALMIFLFSAQNGAESGGLSDRITRWLLKIFYGGFSDLAAKRQSELVRAWSLWVRKAGHFGEFFLLGLFVRLLLHWLPVPYRSPIGFASGALYAVTDEIHQKYVSGRAAMAGDVLIDSAGVLCGVMLAVLLLFLLRRRKRKAAE